jgi:hypothetical protein
VRNITHIISKEITCPICQNQFKIIWEASINTWLDPDLIKKILDDAYYYECPECNRKIHLDTKILINCPKAMFWISTAEDLEVKQNILRKYEVIDENNKIIRPSIKDMPQREKLGERGPNISSFLNKELEKIKKEILKDEKLDKNNSSDD